MKLKNTWPVLFCLTLTVAGCNSGQPEGSTILPKPTGAFDVGTQSISFERPGAASATRHLNVQLYYPVQGGTGGDPVPYFYDTLLVGAMKADRYLDLADSILEKWRQLKAHAVRKNMEGNEKYPLIVFAHGFGMSRVNYTALVENLASHGYIVANIDHPGSGLTILPGGVVSGLVREEGGPDKKVIDFCEDASYVRLNLLRMPGIAEHLDGGRAGMIGHSLGGAAAFNVDLYDANFKAVVNLDGFLFGRAMDEGVSVPYLAVLQNPGGPVHVSDTMKNDRKKEWADIAKKSNSLGVVINILGTSHFDFSDLPFLVPGALEKNGGVLPARRCFDILASVTVAFFDQFLKDKKTDVREVIKKYPEVGLELEKEVK